ncbi:hypothetical protein BJV78DRAFT_1288066 [Lactifluus subvellereus]|nr:hypothetical protein BJV78DRAFT_1288066 [Lactifluus subvellereus]
MSPQLPSAHGTSRPGTPAPFPTFSSSLTSPVPRKLTVSSATAPPLVLPAAQINLSPSPLPYKHLTLDATHWILTSAELHSLVSGAIRESAKGQLIRLFPSTIIDTQMPEDVARIEHSWNTASALRRTAATCCCAHWQHPAQITTCSPNTAAPHPTSIRTLKICCMRRCNAHSSPLPATPIARAPLPLRCDTRDIDEAWKVAEEQAVRIDDLRAAALEQREKSTTGLGDSVTDDYHPDDDDASGRDGASVDLTMILRAEVIDVTGKPVATQARLTMMRTDHPSGSRALPSAFSSRYQSSSMTPGTDTPLHRQPSTTSQIHLLFFDFYPLNPSTAVPSIASTPILPPSSESHRPPLPSRPRSDGADAREEVIRAGDLIPDPASIFSVTTTASMPDLARGQSLDMPPISDGRSKYHNHAGAKTRRSSSQLLHFDDGPHTRRRSMPFAFKVRSAVVGSGTSAGVLTRDSRGELHWGEGSEDGWEDTREDD